MTRPLLDDYKKGKKMNDLQLIMYGDMFKKILSQEEVLKERKQSQFWKIVIFGREIFSPKIKGLDFSPLAINFGKSIQNGPTPHPQIIVTEGQGAVAVQVIRDKTDEEFTKIENNRELADIQATNILSQGLPRHVFNILKQTRTGKEIWDNVELLIKAAQSSNDAMLATMNQIVNLLSGFQKQFPLTNNQLRTSSNSRSHAMVHDGQIVTKTVQRKAPGNVGNTVTRGTHSYGQVTDNKGNLDVEAEAFLADVECTAPYDQPLAITTTNNFEVSHEDTYDSDVDEGPHAAVAFMANLSSTSGTSSATTSHVNKVHTDDNQIFNNVNHLLAHEMHQEEHLDSNVESDIDDNTIPYI
nr:hypothetical protein [Tanacetum cinerariifolium]